MDDGQTPHQPAYVYEAVLRTIKARPHAVAISTGARQITYAELGSLYCGISTSILAAGTTRGACLALCFTDRWKVVPAMLACMAVGCPFVPLDPGIPDARIKRMLESANVAALVCEARADQRELSAVARKAIRIAFADVGVPPTGVLDSLSSCQPLAPHEFATVYFTSGSTGNPKAIAGRLVGVDAFVRWEILTLALDAECRVSQLGSPCFDGFLKDVFVPLVLGGTVCIPNDPELLTKSRELADWLERERVSVLHMVPSTFRQLMDEPRLDERLTSLQALVLAGEAMRPADVRKLNETFGERVVTLNLYGPTETTLTKLCHIVRAIDAEATTVPIGRPMPQTQVCIVGDDGRTCPPGTVGEITITTPLRALGYLGQPELTASKFVPDPLGSTELAYRTGDLGRVRADGEFEFVGRADNQVKIRGVRIEPEELEAVFALHPDVVHAAVVPSVDALGEPALDCYCVARTKLPASALRQHAAALLPLYMLPATVHVVDDLPLTPNGKVDRVALAGRRPEIQRAPLSTDATSSTVDAVAAVFAEVLELQNVDHDESFFILGGHSLLSVKLLARIYKRLAVELSIRELLEHSSVCALAALIEQRRGPQHA